MGTSIHLFVEKRNPQGKWEVVLEDPTKWDVAVEAHGVDILRPEALRSATGLLAHVWGDHGLFAALGGVEGKEGALVVPPRGFPEDLSVHAAFFYSQFDRTDDPSLHHTSWLSLNELYDRDWREWPKFQALVDAIQEHCGETRKVPQRNYRIVFGFNS